MNPYGGKEMAAAFKTVRNNTIKIAEEIPEDKYSFRATPETRSIGQLLTHIALITNFPMHIHGNKIDDLKAVNFPELMKEAAASEAKPRSKAEILDLLKTQRDKFASFLEGTSDGFLAERVATPPGGEVDSRSRFEMLLSAKEHEMHHRAQLMMLQRMIGITPHLTRQMQERMARAQGQAQAQTAR